MMILLLRANRPKSAANNKLPQTGIPTPAAGKLRPEDAAREFTAGLYANTRCRKPAQGFTLLEVMVALAVMSIVLVSVYRMHSQSIAMNGMARFYTQAPLLAQSKMAELEAASHDSLSGGSGDFGEDFPGYTWQVDVNAVSSEALGEVADDLVRIDVSVSFNENEYTYDLRTYRFLRE